MQQQIVLLKTSKVTPANSKSKSLRATIPNNVVASLKLDKDCVIAWEIVKQEGKTYARVRRLE